MKKLRTLLLVGNGAKVNNDIHSFIHTNQVNVVYSMNGKGIVSDYDTLNLGMIGWKGNTYANEILKQCEHLIVIGSRLDVRQITDVNILAGKLISYSLDDSNIASWVNQRINDFNKIESCINLISNFSRNYTVVTDVGENQLITCNAWYSDFKHHFVTSGGIGTMGFAIPGAIGVSMVRPAIAITGDGGFQMNIQELETIKHYNLPIKIIVINNAKLKLVADFETECGIGNHSTIDDYSCVDIESVCNAYGIKYTNSTKEFIHEDQIVYEIRS